MKTIRCAVYTRKSNDEGLEKEFNTLEAQREAGENFIKSQIYQGWKLIEKHYDDAGYSGGTMKRPALQELLEDIKAGEVDMIVVYKVDRLSRSLSDFFQMIKIFDEHNCSFISVTQNFNTGDSMGRLMLNVLLSFAQFEREISGERIRDKIAATRKKGMWTGGRIPFGYRIENKKLEIYPPYAKVVEHIFEEYSKTASEVRLCEELNNSDVLSGGEERYRNFARFQPSVISSIITNPVYIGKLKFKNELYKGIHEAIVNEDIFKRVNELKQQKHRDTPASDVPLNGVLRDLLECGYCNSAMDISFTRKNGRRYKYYICHRVSTFGKKACEVKPINAGELENLVIQNIKPLFTHPALIQELAHQTKEVSLSCQEPEVFDAMHSFEDVFKGLTLSGQQEVLKSIIQKISIFKDVIIIRFRPQIAELLSVDFQSKFIQGTYNLEIPYCKSQKRNKTYILNEHGKCVSPVTPDKSLVKALIRSFQWTKMMEEMNLSRNELAARENIDKGYLGKILKLSILAPDIIESILNGTQPIHLTVETFIRTSIPYRWEEQRIKFGFPAR